MSLRFSTRSVSAIALMLAVLPFAGYGCAKKNAPFIDPNAEDVTKPTSGWGLEKVPTSQYPDMRSAWMDKTNLEQAINKSLQFLRAPSSQRWYPSGNPGDTVTHAQVAATMDDMLDMLRRNISPDEFQQQLLTRYDVYTSVGYNGKGDVWFTGYFTPIYQGSRTRTAEYQYPIYSRPADLVTDPLTGKVQGTYPTRRELTASGKLNGLELLWFRKPIEPFMIQVQGSAQVNLTDGSVVRVGYSGSNGRDHIGLGTQLMNEGILDKKHVSLPAVLDYFEKNPGKLNEYILRDDRIAFQKIYTDAESREWPTGSLNVQATTDRTIATDKNSDPAIFPRASMVFMDVAQPNAQGVMQPKQSFALDQDNGGGIRAAGRADIYMGIGPLAGQRAGEEFAQGRLYYLFIKPEHIDPVKHPSSLLSRPGALPARGGALPTGTPNLQPPARGGAAPSEMFPGAVQPR